MASTWLEYALPYWVSHLPWPWDWCRETSGTIQLRDGGKASLGDEAVAEEDLYVVTRQQSESFVAWGISSTVLAQHVGDAVKEWWGMAGIVDRQIPSYGANIYWVLVYSGLRRSRCLRKTIYRKPRKILILYCYYSPQGNILDCVYEGVNYL